MGAVVLIDIMHLHSDDPEKPDNMALMFRALLDPEQSCEHEIAIAALLVKKLNEIQGDVVVEAARLFIEQNISMSDEKEDTGETLH